MVAKRRGIRRRFNTDCLHNFYMAQTKRQPRTGKILAMSPRIGRRPSRSMEHAMETWQHNDPEIGTRAKRTPRRRGGSRARPLDDCRCGRSDCRDSRRDACLAWRRARDGPGMMFGGCTEP